MQINRINDKIEVSIDFWDWKSGDGNRINTAIKSLPYQDRKFDFEQKKWIVNYTQTYSFMLQDLKYGGGLNLLESFSKEEAELIDNEFLSQFKEKEEWINII